MLQGGRPVGATIAKGCNMHASATVTHSVLLHMMMLESAGFEAQLLNNYRLQSGQGTRKACHGASTAAHPRCEAYNQPAVMHPR